MSTAANSNPELLLPRSAPAGARRIFTRAAEARTFPRHPKTGLTLAVHYWVLAAFWAAVLILAMVGVYCVETYLLHLKHTPLRMVASPTEMAVRFFGLAHYTVATYLLLTSKKLHNLRGWLMLGLFSLLAAAACGAFYFAGGDSNIVAVIGVFFFFLMHALRDEVFFYRLRSGKAISDDEYPHVYRMLIWLQVAGLCLLSGALYAAFIYKFSGVPGHARLTEWIDALFPRAWPLGIKMLASAAPLVCVALFALVRIQRQHRGGIVNLLTAHFPLAIILALTVAIAIASILVGTATLNFLILVHFTGWFIFATAGIARQPKEVRQAATWRTPNQWIRVNMVGFWVFHGGLAAMFLTLVAVNHWVLAQRPLVIRGLTMENPLTLLFSQHSLYYWTITHCTLGFLPKPAPKRR